ncbi:hypothetical protein SeLEV6574_g01394 [Synchytrium endobioticum]|nr:hypothetical protein SeLEV6574_g01394 [Synchytrium endobioticum]
MDLDQILSATSPISEIRAIPTQEILEFIGNISLPSNIKFNPLERLPEVNQDRKLQFREFNTGSVTISEHQLSQQFIERQRTLAVAPASCLMHTVSAGDRRILIKTSTLHDWVSRIRYGERVLVVSDSEIGHEIYGSKQVLDGHCWVVYEDIPSDGSSGDMKVALIKLNIVE